MAKISFELKPKAPYDFDLHWKFYSSSEPQAETYKNGVWRRLIKIENRLFPVAVSSVGTVDKPRLKINIYSKISAAEKKELSDKITYFFKIRNDVTELYEFMDRDKVLRKVKNQLYGLRPPGIGLGIFESIVRVIIQQQISLHVAYVMTGALVRRFGEKMILRQRFQ